MSSRVLLQDLNVPVMSPLPVLGQTDEGEVHSGAFSLRISQLIGK